MSSKLKAERKGEEGSTLKAMTIKLRAAVMPG
jgi:hypothetical protein